MRNIRLDIEYDGTNYSGWQRQENGKSIQGEIEDILSRVLQEKCTLYGAGRTDAGVHARGQVANFHTEAAMTEERLSAALNGLLPGDIVVRNVAEVSPEFHARFGATSRKYSYHIIRIPTALERNTTWYVRYEFDMGLMQLVANRILGRHDFQSFCRVGAEVQHHFCNIVESVWSGDAQTLVYEIRADRFLHGMVRTLVGTMVDIGRGYRTIDELEGILDSKDRKEAGPAAPARGLILEEVTYT